MNLIYLDNGATTKVDDKVIKKMLPYFNEKFGNASSLHQKGQEARMALEESRRTVANAISAKPSEIIFTSGGSESNNLAIKGVAYEKGRGHIITSKIEHPCVLRTVEELEKKGFEATYIDVDSEGFIDLDQLKNSIRKDTILISVMHANNEIGTIQPIEQIAELCKKHDIIFHTDAVQSFTKIPISVKKLKIDLISFSGHKFHGPKGIGALYIRERIKLKKQMHGGSQERKLRAGTENISGIVGFAEATKIIKNSDIKNMTKLRDKLIDFILNNIDNARLNGSRERRLCNNVNISFDAVEGEAIGGYLDAKGICSSTGSACSSKSLEPSHVLKTIGLTHEEAHGSLRLTLSKYTKEKDIDFVIKVLPDIIKKLRKMSPIK